MFLHATATGWSKHNHAICWGRREPSVEGDLRVEPTTMELVSHDSTQEEITELCWDVYQLWRLPRRSRCEEEMEECICQEVLDSIKISLWCKQLSVLPEAEKKQRLADAHRPNPQADFAATHHATYEQFAAMQQDSCQEALALARYTPACPGSCGHTRGENGMDEPFPQLLVLGQLLALWKLLVLRKSLMPEIHIIRTIKGRSPGDTTLGGCQFP